MCSIAGVFSRKGENVFPFLCDMLSMMSHRGSDGFGAAVGSEVAKFRDKKQLFSARLKGTVGVGHSLLSITGHGLQPFSSCDKKSFLCHNGQIYNYLELNESLSSHTFESDSDSEAILHFLEEHDFNFKKFMLAARGSYAVAFMHKGRLFAFRDPMGVRPLWFGENSRFFAFASEEIALKKLGIEFPVPLLPGHSLEVSKNGFSTKKVFSLHDFQKTVPKKYSFETLFSSFKESIFLRSHGVKKVGVLFSGGIDSSVVAKALSENTKNISLFCCGVEGSHDLSFAEKVASDLSLPFFPRVVQKDEVPFFALKTLLRLSRFDRMQLSIALPMHGACELAKKKGCNVVLSGQGSDEIFAGYTYFKKELSENGFSGVNDLIWSNLSQMWSRNLFRDDLMSMANGVELRVPFLDTEFLRTAMACPASEKLHSASDDLRKHPVREMGKRLGLPSFVLNQQKKAMQYGSGFAKEVEKLF